MHQQEEPRSKPRLMKLAPLRPAVSNAVWVSNDLGSFGLDIQDQQLFNRFRHHTILSLGGIEFVDAYEGKLLADSFTVSVPFTHPLNIADFQVSCLDAFCPCHHRSS